jgi:hypothetical protein
MVHGISIEIKSEAIHENQKTPEPISPLLKIKCRAIELMKHTRPQSVVKSATRLCLTTFKTLLEYFVVSSGLKTSIIVAIENNGTLDIEEISMNFNFSSDVKPRGT